jgi:hypothetical protein
MKLACSACGALLTQGETNCPGCALPLVSRAVPVIPKSKPPMFPLWSVLLVFFICICLAGALERPGREKAEAAQKVSDDAAFAAHREFVESVSNVKTFQSHCGAATDVRQGISSRDSRDLDSNLARHATTLIYKQSPTEMHVIFTGDKELPILFREHLGDKTYSFTPYKGLVEMGCAKE